MFYVNTLPDGMKDADRADRAEPLRMESRGLKRTTAEDETILCWWACLCRTYAVVESLGGHRDYWELGLVAT